MSIAEASSPTVSLRDVSVQFDTDVSPVVVLSDINFDVFAGEVMAVCGLSGAGKSTLLRVIAGLEVVRDGQVLHQGKKSKGIPDGIGYVVQNYSQSLFPWFSVEKNLKLAIREQKLSSREKKKIVSSALADVGLGGYERSKLWQLSGGMQQRVAIARALIGEKNLLLMDEPFASVDSEVRQELEDLTLEVAVRKGIATLVVTHDIEEAVYMADRILVVGGKPGRIVADIMVNLPRPRSQLETREHSEFARLRRLVRDAIWPDKPPVEANK